MVLRCAPAAGAFCFKGVSRIPKKAHFKHLRGDSAYYPYGARTHLRRRQRGAARLLRAAGLCLLGVAALLLVRQTWGRGGQPAPPPSVSAAPVPSAAAPAPVTVAVRPATADVERDVLDRTADADAAAHADPLPAVSPGPDPARAPAEVLPAYRALWEQNQDLVGWLRIDGTDIDYPVVQRPDDNDYYLRRGFDGLYAPGGTLFLDARCDPGPDGATANWLVYGHNMTDGSMFGTLARYADEAFWREHPAFTFDTLYESGTWQVAAVLRTELGADELPYYAFFDAADRARWQTWMDAILPLALYDTGVQPRYGDQLLTLSTCGDTAPGTAARLAVLAVRAG